MARKATPRVLERDVQRQVQRLLSLAGCVVYSTAQGFRADPGGTRMTPGLPDLLMFLPALVVTQAVDGGPYYERGLGFFEVKTPEGLRRHERGVATREKRALGQQHFADLCRVRGIPYGLGGIPEAWAFLGRVGLAERRLLAPGTPGEWTLLRRTP